MRKLPRVAIQAFIGLLLLSLPASAFGKASINLTAEERTWLAAHPKIIGGGETDWAPFDFVTKTRNTPDASTTT